MARSAPQVMDSSQALSAATSEISIMTYNTLCPFAVRIEGQEHTMFRHCADGVIDWSTRKGRLVSTILQASADIVCLQEVGGRSTQRLGQPAELPEWLHVFAEDYDAAAYYLRPRKKSGSDAKDGNVTLFRRSKFSLLHAAAVKTKGQYRSVVTILRAREEPNAVLAVCNVHLEGNPDAHLERQAQLRAALDHIAQHLPAEGHVVVAGDFNSDMAGISDALHGEGRFELSDAFPAVNGPLLGAITLAEAEATFSVDHVLVGSSLDIVCRRRVLEDQELAMVRAGLPSVDHPSDHLPVALVVRPRANTSPSTQDVRATAEDMHDVVLVGGQQAAAQAGREPLLNDLETLNEHLRARSYLDGTASATESDFRQLRVTPPNVSAEDFPHVARWGRHIRFLSQRKVS